ncbi:MAG: protein TolQ [Deltaproteobacteria bacterium]|nr:protein TolQ [Deltaproteobacteria bacterium]
MSLTALSPVAFLPGGLSLERAFASDIIQMVLHAGLMVKFVIMILVCFSVVSWTIIFMKWRLFRLARQEAAFFLDLFWEGRSFQEIHKECDDLIVSPVVQIFKAGYSELKQLKDVPPHAPSDNFHSGPNTLLDNFERVLSRTAIEQNGRFEKALSFLATTGNTAPFIGLFGTVWGIMESFRGIGLKGSASLAVVAPGISEALIATAAGLAAAIPAVVAFNFFSHRAVVLRSEMDTFSSDFLSIVKKQLDRKTMTGKGS